MSDQYDEQAAALLPCQWITRLCDAQYEELCYGCYHRPAVAAKLRELGTDNDRLRAKLSEHVDCFWYDCKTTGERGANYCQFEGTKVCILCQMSDLRQQLAEWKQRAVGGMCRILSVGV